MNFYSAIVLPTKLRIKGKMSDLLATSMSKATLDAISASVNEASQPMNIAFWSPDQFDIASNCLSYKRVLFTPYKTGKIHW